MKPQIIVDTNVLVSFVTDRDQRQQELAGNPLPRGCGR